MDKIGDAYMKVPINFRDHSLYILPWQNRNAGRHSPNIGELHFSHRVAEIHIAVHKALPSTFPGLYNVI